MQESILNLKVLTASSVLFHLLLSQSLVLEIFSTPHDIFSNHNESLFNINIFFKIKNKFTRIFQKLIIPSHFSIFHLRLFTFVTNNMNNITKKILSGVIILLFLGWITTTMVLYARGFQFELFFKHLELNRHLLVWVFLLLFIFRNYFLIPSTVLILACGYFLQDFWLTLLVTSLWVCFGIIQTYFVGFVFGEDFHDNKKFQKLESHTNRIKEKWWEFIFAWALFPLIPLDVIYYSAGLIHYSFVKTLLAGFFWELPLIIIYSFLGKEAEKYEKLSISVAIGIGVLVGMYYYFRHVRKGKVKSEKA